MRRSILTMACVLLLAPPARAAITYVDAIPDGEGANVTVQGAVPGTGDPPNFILNQKDKVQTDADGVWSERNRDGLNGGNVLVARGANDATDDGDGILWTRTPELPAGTYFVYVFFWNDNYGEGRWDCAAALDEKTSMAELTPYTRLTATNLGNQTQLDGFDLPADLKTQNGGIYLCSGSLGLVTLAEPGPITVSVAGWDDPNNTNLEERTWFDGIGYVEASCALLPDPTIEPVAPGATSVTVSGIDPAAERVNLYLNDALLASEELASPAPETVKLDVAPLAVDDRICARQVIDGMEKCGPVPETVVKPAVVLTYVDAVPGGEGANVTVQGAAIENDVNFLLDRPDSASTAEGYAEADDGFWGERNREAANGGSVLVSKGSADAADDGDGILWTKTPELPAGTYFVYLFFWNGGNGQSNWDCAAAIGEKTSMAELTVYTKANATDIAGRSHVDGFGLPATLRTDDGDQNLFGVPLGLVTLTEAGSITVSTAGYDQPSVTTDERTWFDGIGYVEAPCGGFPDVTVDPVDPGVTSVTVRGIDPDAQRVNLYVNDVLTGFADLASPAPDSMTFDVPPLALNDRLYARQVFDGVEKCGPVPETTVASVLVPQITFVDAVPNTTGTDGNTTVNGALVDYVALPDDPVGNATTGNAMDNNSDGLSHYRTVFANGGGVWETMDETTTPEPLVTTLSLTPGTYNLYGMYWTGSNGREPWDAAFRVGPTGAYLTFASDNSIVSSVSGGEFHEPTLTREGNRALMIAPLGQYTVTGSVDIYVLAPNRGVDNERSWYDGVGYELVAEPAGPLNVADGFGDGDRDNDGVLEGPAEDPQDTGLAWRSAPAYAQGFEPSPPFPPEFAVRVAPDTAEGLGEDNALHVDVVNPQAILVANFPTTTLAKPGDFIRLTFQVRLPEVINFGDTFRFGLFHDGGTPARYDQLDAGLLDDDFGYVAAIATGVDSGESHLAGNVAGGNFGSLLGSDELFAPEDAFDEVINDTAPHTLSLIITRALGGNAIIEVVVDGASATRVLDGSVAPLTFNEVSFGTSPVMGISFILDDVRVESGETAMDFCGTVPPLTINAGLIPVGTPATITVDGVVPSAEIIHVYKNGEVLIASAPSNGSRSQTIDLPALEAGDMLSARQVVEGVESCAPVTEVMAGNCELVPALTIAPRIPAGIPTSLTINGVSPEAEYVHVYLNEDPTPLASIAGSPPETPASLMVDVPALEAGDALIARQVLSGVESCAPVTPKIVADCADVAPLAIFAPFARDTTVSVLGVDGTASVLKVYQNGTEVIATREGPFDNPTITIPVPPLAGGSRLSVTQTIGGVESCILEDMPVLKSRMHYVDAVPNTTGTDGNTTVNGALVNFDAGGNATLSGSGSDHLWFDRKYAGVNGPTIWESDAVDAEEDTEPLVTTLTLPPGTYNLYGLFYNNNNAAGKWDAEFRVGDTGDYKVFTKANAMITTGNEFFEPTNTRAGGQWLVIASLGQFEVSESGTIDIYVNGPDTTTGDDRTWYDGVAWSPACGDPFADVDGDLDVDQDDFGLLQRCLFETALSTECACLDLGKDGLVDQNDFNAFDACYSGPMIPADTACDD